MSRAGKLAAVALLASTLAAPYLAARAVAEHRTTTTTTTHGGETSARFVGGRPMEYPANPGPMEVW